MGSSNKRRYIHEATGSFPVCRALVPFVRGSDRVGLMYELHTAAGKGFAERVGALISSGAVDIDERGPDGFTCELSRCS